MLTMLQRHKYVMTQIISEGDAVNLYVAQSKKNNKFCVSEIKDVETIEKILQDKLPEDADYFDIFTENKFLYIITPYSDGESLATYIKYQGYNTHKKILLLKDAAFKFTRFADYSEILRNNALIAKNVIAVGGKVGFNHFIFETEPSDCYTLFSELIKSCFRDNEISKLTYLSIILRKLEHSLYNNFAEVYIDLNELEKNISSSLTLMQKAKELFYKHQWIIKAAFTVFMVIAAIFGIYTMLAGDGEDEAGNEYNPIMRIGTVDIAEREQ